LTVDEHNELHRASVWLQQKRTIHSATVCPGPSGLLCYCLVWVYTVCIVIHRCHTVLRRV